MRFKAVTTVVLLSASLCAACGIPWRAHVPSPATGVIEGVVIGNDGVIPGATVTLEQDGQTIAYEIVQERARFRFDPIPQGRYVVRAVMNQHLPASRRVNVRDAPLRLTIGLREIRTPSTGIGVSTPGKVPSEINLSWHEHLPNPAGLGAWPISGRIDPGSADPFRLTSASGVSMFGADVDSASFTLVRRLLRSGIHPSFEAVRTDELLNYFDFRYPQPDGDRPVSITSEIGPCPWAPEHRLALIGIRARAIGQSRPKPRRIVLALNNSMTVKPSGTAPGSNRLAMLQTALRAFVDTIGGDDRLAIMTYTNLSGVDLPSTRGSERVQIHNGLEAIGAEGQQLDGEAGIPLAYLLARQHFVRGGINRVIVADSETFDAGSGVTDRAELLELIERERERGIFLTVLDVGRGELREDETVKTLIDRGSAQYAHAESVQEARRVLVVEAGATLETVASNVRFQAELNPARVAAWKLIGYENRSAEPKDFSEDRKDGGELVTGDDVTMLYEIVPAGSPLPLALVNDFDFPVDPMDYPTPSPTSASSRELLTVRVQYTSPGSSTSAVMTKAVREGGSSRRVRLAAAVAEFAQLLRDSDTDQSRWRALIQRVNRLETVVNAADQNEFLSLVALGAERMRGHPSQIKDHSYSRMPDGRNWTTENLNVEAVKGSSCYEGKLQNCQQYRQLYAWQAALEGCQSLGRGWRLPTNEDWRRLAKSVGGVRDDSTDAGAAAYAALVTGGGSGFNAVFGGGRTPERQYERVGAHGFYWTATESDDHQAWFYNFGGLKILNRHRDGEKTRALSVRCVRD